MMLPARTLTLLCVLASALALGTALASEAWDGLVPCALCLLERWPYRFAIALGLLALVVPPRFVRVLLAMLLVVMVVGVGLALTHIGVEQGWWPSPMPECTAPRLSGRTPADRLANMPVHPAKPCDDPTRLPGVPLSMAELNFLGALGISLLAAISLGTATRKRPP